MGSDLEKAQIMFKLSRKNNWNNCYDRTEHFKRFQDLNKILKELSNRGWIIMHNKENFTGISLNSRHKKEIIEFIEAHMPYLKGIIK
jgi:aspartate/tyrosine/aromatic aminotransferase